MKNIKVIAFDLVGVLVKETDFKLSEQYDKLERLFGRDMSNEEFKNSAKLLVGENNVNVAIDYIIQNLYQTKNKDELLKLKNEFRNIKFALATNHVSNIKKYIDSEFGEVFDFVFISADIGLNKPNVKFYEFILNKMNLNAENLLFIDDNIDNIEGAKKLNIQTIHLTKEKDMYNEVKRFVL